MAENGEVDCPNNVQLFRIAISNSLKNITESVSEDKFIEILTILKFDPKIAHKLYEAMMKELYNGMSKDLEDMLSEGSLQNALIKITELTEKSASSVETSQEAWRPPGDVISHLRSLDAQQIEEETEKLERQVNEIEVENETLMKTIADSRSKIRAWNDKVTKVLDRTPTVLQRLERTYAQLTDYLGAIENE